MEALEFKLVLPYPRGGDTINLRAGSAKDAHEWIQAIEKARSNAIEAEKSSEA